MSTAADDFPTSIIGEIVRMHDENKKMKALIVGMMSGDAASNGRTSTALVDASPWADAPSVAAVQAMRAHKKPTKGLGKGAAAQAAVDSGSDDSEPLPRRHDTKGAIGKKQRKKKDKDAKKRGMTGYALFVKENSTAVGKEMADKAAEANEPKPPQGDVFKEMGRMWNLLKGTGEQEEWVAKAKEMNKAMREGEAAAGAGATTGDASPSSVLDQGDDDDL